jgi:hypothetical protein
MDTTIQKVPAPAAAGLRRFARLALLTLVPVTPAGIGSAAAQVIPIKTVPVATGDPFRVFPSDRTGMGSVSIALVDSLGDPFSNPATLARLSTPRLFSAPSAYGITGDNGGAMTLPVGGLFGTSTWHGGIGLALQELDRGREPVDPWWGGWTQERTLSQRHRTNLYGYGAIARSIGARTALGASLTVADLSAISGVDLLYTRQPVDQDGHALDLRLGLVRELVGGGAVEAVLVHSRFDMRHDFVEQLWQPVPVDTLPQEDWPWEPVAVERTERDRTDTWGLHLAHRRPLEAEGWTLGGILTVNYKSHPQIPNYTLMSIPRDPGTSWAYDVGVGMSKRTETAVFGLDVIYEPIWTETWADAAIPVPTAAGDTIPAGDMTVFNDFRFDNMVLRMGAGGSRSVVDLQVGLQLRAYRYTLDQTDFVADRRRRQRENWLEWTPSLGLGLRFADFSVEYTGRITSGTGRPGVAWNGGVEEGVLALTADFLPAPSGALTLDEAWVHAHQLSVAIPVGR